MLWDLNEGKHLYTLEANDEINSLTFSPNRYWLCAAVGPSIKIWVCNFYQCCQKHLWRFVCVEYGDSCVCKFMYAEQERK